METSPWWQVDLGSVHDLQSVTLWNRTDCCSQRLANFYVLVSDVPFASPNLAATLSQPGVTATRHQGVAGRSTTFSFDRSGRYVRVQLEGRGIVSLAEVEIMGSSR